MRQMARLLLLATIAGLPGLGGHVAFAQSEASTAKPIREAAALAFARAHHPELADLLGRLKSADRGAYHRALGDVFQSSERFAKLKENDLERYELSLHVWTLDSRIRLLVARMTMSNDPGTEEELRALLRERQLARLALLRLDRHRLADRIERLDSQINDLESNSAAAIETDFARINREIEASENRARREGKNANPRKPTPRVTAAEPIVEKKSPVSKKPAKTTEPKSNRDGR